MKMNCINPDESVWQATMEVGERLLVISPHGEVILDCRPEDLNAFMVILQGDKMIPIRDNDGPVKQFSAGGIRAWLFSLREQWPSKYGDEFHPRKTSE